jgi:hypothetical protein
VRVIYHHVTGKSQIRMLMVYPKSVKDDLSAAEKKLLRKVVEKWDG